MGAVNLGAVKAFGEFGFWFALIKIVTIIAMVLGGIGIIAFGFGNDGVAVGISNLWSNGGFMPNGVTGVLMSLQMVMFAYLGVEMIGLTAGEARNPQKTIPQAIGSVFWRILLFYVGALFVILSIYPWSEIGSQGSPFVQIFSNLGIGSAAALLNIVVLDLLARIPDLVYPQVQSVRGDKPFAFGMFHLARRSVDLGTLRAGGLVDSVYS